MTGPAASGSLRRSYGVLIALVVLGVLAGVLWAFITPTATITTRADGRQIAPAAELAHLFGGVAVFSLLAFALGLVCGAVVWFVLAHLRGWLGLLVAVLTALLASGIALEVGIQIARVRYPSDLDQAGPHQLVGDLWLDGAHLGSLSAPWVLLVCAPGIAALVYFICAAGSGDSAMPGYREEPEYDEAYAMAGPPPPGWTYAGGPQMPAGPGPDVQVPPATAADAESQTRP